MMLQPPKSPTSLFIFCNKPAKQAEPSVASGLLVKGFAPLPLPPLLCDYLKIMEIWLLKKSPHLNSDPNAWNRAGRRYGTLFKEGWKTNMTNPQLITKWSDNECAALDPVLWKVTQEIKKKKSKESSSWIARLQLARSTALNSILVDMLDDPVDTRL